ncbi:MAG: ATP-binding cassette domain-containing protein [Firmicutes bacterium]|nr:ATP-binding cassette domain-containing protein [Bacillota bacterium]
MLLEFNNLTYSLGSDQNRRVAVSGGVSDGQVLVVRGPSGAGKSTMLRALARLQPCIDGEVKLAGTSWFNMLGTEWRTKVHYLAQKPAVFEGSVMDNLAKPFESNLLKNREFNNDYLNDILQQLLLPLSILEQRAKTLSGGETARMAFARSLLIAPTVLLLDEPTAALDDQARQAFYKLLLEWLSSPGRAAVLVSHTDDYKVLNNINYLDIKGKQEGW